MSGCETFDTRVPLFQVVSGTNVGVNYGCPSTGDPFESRMPPTLQMWRCERILFPLTTGSVLRPGFSGTLYVRLKGLKKKNVNICVSEVRLVF